MDCSNCGMPLNAVYRKPKYDVLCENCNLRAANERLGAALDRANISLAAHRLTKHDAQAALDRYKAELECVTVWAARWKKTAKHYNGILAILYAQGPDSFFDDKGD